ncbi:21599_t:CDS:2 [Gigaspora margarita]|uniref:21599_t:CDS:1 n=1 Tax=Gigaspora margarita TaxID=4874 RepID=A0ABN7WSQ3_GIGMA|nr:21599_t:CDS:2 [Gigaspora margarita]
MPEITQLKKFWVKFHCYKDYEDITKIKEFVDKLTLKVIPSDASDANYAAREALNSHIRGFHFIINSSDNINYPSAEIYLENSLKELILNYIDFLKISPINIENILNAKN